MLFSVKIKKIENGKGIFGMNTNQRKLVFSEIGIILCILFYFQIVIYFYNDIKGGDMDELRSSILSIVGDENGEYVDKIKNHIIATKFLLIMFFIGIVFILLSHIVNIFHIFRRKADD
jgi:hypothetical protein